MLKQVQHDILFCHPEFISGSIFFENRRVDAETSSA